MNRSNNNNRRIYVGNLPSNIDERDLEDIFYKYGDIADVDLKIPRYGTGGTPFAFVEFHDPRYVEMRLFQLVNTSFQDFVIFFLRYLQCFEYFLKGIGYKAWFQFRRCV